MAQYFEEYQMLTENQESLELCTECKFESEDCPAEFDVTDDECLRHKKIMKLFGNLCDGLNKMVEKEEARGEE